MVKKALGKYGQIRLNRGCASPGKQKFRGTVLMERP